MSTFLALQRTQLYSGLAATLDAYSRLLELRYRCCINRDYRDAYDATKNWINRSFKVAQIATELFLKCNSYITWCSTWTKLSMKVYVNTTCNIVRRSAKRCRQVLFEFWFWRGDSLLLQNNRRIGGVLPKQNWRSVQLRFGQFFASGRPLANLATVENRQKSKIGEWLILLFV